MKRIRMIIAVMIAVSLALCLSSCCRVVRGPAVEITMFSWYCEQDNGNTLKLSFHDNKADFFANNSDFSLSLSGTCMIDNSSFVICDEETGFSFPFTYVLHGDSLELTFGDGTLTLDKVK